MKRSLLVTSILWLSLTAVARAEVVYMAQSGVDWKKSSLSVERFQPSHPNHRENFNCFGQDYEALPLRQNLYDLGFTNADKGPLTLSQTLVESACFQQAGWYQLKLELVDYAGNASQKSLVLTVLPAELSLIDSPLEPVASKTSGGSPNVTTDLTKRLNCTSSTLVADGEDQCVLELKLRDRFANVVTPEALTGNITLTLPEEAVAENLDARTNTYGAFLAGLSFENDQRSFTWRFPSALSQLKLGLKALVPSLEVNPQTTMPEVVPQALRLRAEYRSRKEGAVEQEAIKTIKPLFSPWVNLLANQAGSLENFVLLPINRTITLPLRLQGNVNKTLPAKLTLDWSRPTLENLWVQFTQAENEEKDQYTQKVAVESNPQSLSLDLNLLQPEGLVSEASFRLQPVVTYPAKWQGKTALVRYPLNLLQGQGLDPIPAFETLKLQAAVIGRLLGADPQAPTGESLVLSDTDEINFRLWREQVNRQAIALVRGQTPRQEAVFDINQDWGESDVAYFKGGTVRLDSQDPGKTPMQFGSGVKTLIIEDGNLHITRDLVYKSQADSLGIIAINSQSNDPLRGHVFVHQNVQHLVGSYFLDGSLVSTQKLEQPEITDIITGREATPNQDPDSPLALQLVLEGTVVARNTLGGADQSPARGPNKQNLQRELALIYDLNYVRRYEPLFNESGQRVPDLQNNYCYKSDGKTCFPNPAPLVIMYDPRVQQLPPPGFGGE